MANAKAEAFKKFIESKDSGAFGVEENPKDELHTVLFHSRLKAGNVEYPFIVTVDDSVFVTLRVLLDQAVVKGEKRAAVLEEMNRLNHTYKSFKHYVDQGGSMVLDACLIMPEKMEGSLIYNMLTMMMEHLEHVGDGIRKAAGIKTPEGPGLSIVK